MTNRKQDSWKAFSSHLTSITSKLLIYTLSAAEAAAQQENETAEEMLANVTTLGDDAIICCVTL